MNWKVPGPDNVHGYWVKRFVSIWDRIAFHLQYYVTRPEVPGWMATGRAPPIIERQAIKKQSKQLIASYRTVPNSMWQICFEYFIFFEIRCKI